MTVTPPVRSPSAPAAISESPALAESWTALEQRGAGSFFQSWAWIGCWLRTLPPEIVPRVIELKTGGETRGLALLTSRDLRRYTVLRSRARFLHETGDPALDSLTIERNGLLTADPQECSTGDLVTRLAGEENWDELYLGGLEAAEWERVKQACANHRLNAVTRWTQPIRHVDLERVRAQGGDYLALLGKNSRSQIRRSLRLYEELGPLTTQVATGKDEARRTLQRLKTLHQAYWIERGQPGAFAGRFFNEFHDRLVDEGIDQGRIQLIRIAAGEQEIGYLYNFVHRGRVSNYQSGFDYPADNRLKPGLVSHYLALQYNLDAGLGVYDFLAGGERYKESLATDAGELVWGVVQQPRWRFRLEAALKRVKHRLEPGRARPSGPAQSA